MQLNIFLKRNQTNPVMKNNSTVGVISCHVYFCFRKIFLHFSLYPMHKSIHIFAGYILIDHKTKKLHQKMFIVIKNSKLGYPGLSFNGKNSHALNSHPL